MKNIMFIAPPAAGKGTQAERVVEKYHIPHISTGDILREISKEDSEIGEYVRETLASGKLVKDEITYQLIEDRLKKDDCKNGLKFVRLDTNNPTTLKKSRDSKILNYSRNSSIYQ